MHRWLLVLLGILLWNPVFAGLGDPFEADKADDQQKRVASLHFDSRRLEEHPSFRLRVSVSSVLELREYESHGKTFALTWKGPIQPDLQPLLSQYYGEFSEEMKRQVQAQKQNSTPRKLLRAPFSRIETEHLVVERWGKMKAMSGKAYAKDLVPANFKMEEIQ